MTAEKRPGLTRRPTWSRRKEARPDEILAAALEQFVTHGYSASRIEDIARAAGVTKGTLYLYFSGKEDILKNVVSTVLVPVVTDMETRAVAPQGSAVTLLRELLLFWLEQLERQPLLAGFPKLMLTEASNFPELAAYYHQEVIMRARRIVMRLLNYGIERGEFQPCKNVALRAELVLAPLTLRMLWRYSFANFEPSTPPSDELAAELLSCFLDGLYPRTPIA